MCGKELNGRVPTRPYPKNEKWYKAKESIFYCLHCDTNLTLNHSLVGIVSFLSSSVIVIGSVFLILLTNKDLIWILILLFILEGIFLYYINKVKLRDWPRWKKKEIKL